MDALLAAETLSLSGMALVVVYAVWRVHVTPRLARRRAAAAPGA